MTHVFAFLVINSLFGTALYSPYNVVRKSLFNVAGMVTLAYGLLLVFTGVSWLIATLVTIFIAIEAFRRGQLIQSDTSNREWVELQLVLLLILVTTAYAQQLSVIMLQASALVVFVFVALIVNILMRRHVNKHSFKPAQAPDKLPTVSLLIPARNEDHALEPTLNRALESDYPKLEILVLDDCSQDNTPEIIRSFAHKGVRFVEGEPLTGDWYGKNFAIEQLRKSASGDIHMYADVDVQLQPHTISELVAYMLQEKVTMVSVLPARRGFDLLPMFIRTLYEFTITLAPFGALKTARAYGSFFAVTSKVARNYSFEQSKNNIIPEQHLATKLKAVNRYQSIIGDWSLGVTVRKKLSSQITTQHRTLYPLLGNNTVGNMLYSVGLFAVAVLPFTLVPGWFSLFVYAGYVVAYIQYLLLNSPQSIFLAPFQLGLLLVLESFMTLYSLITYSFSELSWKDRRICIVPNLKKAKQI